MDQGLGVDLALRAGLSQLWGRAAALELVSTPQFHQVKRALLRGTVGYLDATDVPTLFDSEAPGVA